VELKPCPCHSGKRYADCCAPFHRREREPDTPEQLMRSRYSGFALGLGEHLLRTLASTHPDRAHQAEHFARARDSQRFAGLRILETSAEGDRGMVYFAARIYDRGRDVSFSERSRFVREGGAWKYESGEIITPPPR
jgi:SEC-C motif-containing protein